MRHQIIVLGDRQRDAGDVGFLKRIGAEELAADLAGDADDRRRIHHGRGDAGDHVGRARTGGGHSHADFAGRARIAIGHVRRALLVAHQNVANGAVPQRVVGRQDGAARIAEDGFHALAFQTFPQNSRADHRFLFAFHRLPLNSHKNKNPPCQRLWQVGLMSLLDSYCSAQ